MAAIPIGNPAGLVVYSTLPGTARVGQFLYDSTQARLAVETAAGWTYQESLAYATTATAAGTTTLTAASATNQYFTGTTTQTVTLPVASTLFLGWRVRVVNKSTGIVTVNSSGGNAVLAVPAGSSATFSCILTSGTNAASWDPAGRF